MSYDRVSPYRLSECAAEWLDKSRLFSRDQKFFNELPIRLRSFRHLLIDRT